MEINLKGFISEAEDGESSRILHGIREMGGSIINRRGGHSGHEDGWNRVK